jgi:hypothetical protein
VNRTLSSGRSEQLYRVIKLGSKRRIRVALYLLFYTRYYYGDKIREREMDETYSAHGLSEKYNISAGNLEE